MSSIIYLGRLANVSRSIIKESVPTTTLSILPVHVLESIFRQDGSYSIDCVYENDPYTEYVIVNLISLQVLKIENGVQ